ncbi:MAG: serine/threonine protein kinase [Proteobacteria bacterium]|nr:serine/threonine protein kinase [Pseudomonadota bacterium]
MLPREETPVDRLTEEQRKAAFSAAVCFERCGHHERAVGLYCNLGKLGRASDLLKKLGRRQDAALALRGLPISDNPWRPGFLWALIPHPAAGNSAVIEIADDSFDDSLDDSFRTAEEDMSEDESMESLEFVMGEEESAWLAAPEFEALHDPGVLSERQVPAPPDPVPALPAAPAPPTTPEKPPWSSSEWLSGKVSSSSSSWHLRSDEQNKEVQEDLRTKSQELGLWPLHPGSVIANRFRIDGPIGEGGYAVVFRATDLELEEAVALKLFKDETRDPNAVGRFKQEMRIARKLSHPNIVSTFEFGTWRGAYFLTMELMRGTDLEVFTQDMGGVLEPALAVDLVKQAMAGLGHAHDLDVVHRDIKPRNLFVLEGGQVLKVMDFGIAKTSTDAASWTRTGRVVGTPCFIPPERLKRGQQGVLPQTDLYAMGVVLFRLLTGVLPFDDRDIASLFHKVLREPAPSLRDLDESLPPALARVVDKLLEKDPADRYAHANLAIDALDQALADPW